MSSPSGGDSHRREPEYARRYAGKQASGSSSPDAPLPAQDGRHHPSDTSWLFPPSFPSTSHTYHPRSQPTTPTTTTTAATVQPPSSNTAQGSAMIPVPTFYDPEHAAPQQTQDYHAWLEHNYAQSQQSFAFDTVVPYTQDTQQPAPAQMQRPMQTQAQAPAPLTNQYHFVPSQPAQQAPPKDGSSYSTYFAAPTNAATNTSSRPMASRFVHQTGMPASRGRNATGASMQAPSVDYLAPEVFYMGTGGDDTAGAQYEAYTAGSEHLTPTSYTHGTPDSQTAPSQHSVSPTWNDERQLPGLSTSASASTARPVKRAAGKKGNGNGKGRKRARKDGGAGDESEWEVEEEDVQQPQGRMDGLPQRLPGACTYCKKLKMKCDFPKHENVCKRCKAGGHHCVVEGRKPRSAPNKREYLLAQIRQKDVIIESLLKQLHNPYLATPLSIAAYRMATPSSDNHRQNVIAWLDRMQSSVRRTPGAGAGFTLPRETPADDESDGGSETAPEHESDEPPTSAHTLVDPEAETYPGLPDTAVPLGLLANLSISNSKQKGKSALADLARAEDPNDDDDNVGVANDTYFLPGPAQDLALRAMLIDKSSPPDILVHGLVSPEDVDKLFEIFYTKVNPFIGVLDPALHTPATTFSRCPFLFTVVCATALRYSDKSEVYPIAMHFAKSAAANALIDGWKSVELCQAYILMSIYAVPARRWEEDRSWLYTGLAIRIATDLNLHQLPTRRPQNEAQEREMLNRARMWMVCYNLDRSVATQFGKPTTIKEDYIIRNSTEWYKKSKYNHEYDIHLNAYNSLLRIVSKFHDEVFSDPSSPTGLNKHIDFRDVTTRHDRDLTGYHEEWAERFAQDSDQNDPACQFRCKLLPFLVNYSRLVMYSFGFQQAFQRGLGPDDALYVDKSLEAAKTVVQTLVDSLAPTGYMRCSPDGHFVFASFASAFMLKLCRPEFAQFLPTGQEAEIFELISRLIQVLSSPQIAIDERHTPKLYSRFLAGLLAKHRRDGATSGRLHTQPPPAQTHQGQGPGGSGAQGQNPIHRTPSANSASSLEIQIHGVPDTGMGTGFGMAPAAAQEPVYEAEATYSAGTGPLEVGGGGGAMDFDFAGMASGSEGDVLAAMQVIRNPEWWSNMMMPGFTWPADQVSAADPNYFGGGLNNGVANAYNFQMAQVPLG